MLNMDIKFGKDGLVPAIIQDAESREVLMMAYMNKESLEKTLETGLTHFWSRSRQELWQKGETSGNIQKVKEILFDCDNDTILVKVSQKGNACHTGQRTCFYKKLNMGTMEILEKDRVKGDLKPMAYYDKSHILQSIYDIVMERKNNPKEGSYTNYLFKEGIDKILKKVGEESAEVIIAAKNRVQDELIYETADLLYHLIVTLAEQGIAPDRVYEELSSRFKPGT